MRQQGALPQARQVAQPPVNASLAPKNGVFAPDIVQKNPKLRGDDRHSKNGYPPLSQVNRVIPKAPARVVVTPSNSSTD